MAIYDSNGNKVDTGSVDYNATVLSVNHRGYSIEAPENTLPAYKLSKQMGFDYVETDVSFTKDGIPVLLHDSTIDRTSDGSGNINNLTFAQVRECDFGSWKSAKYTGTKIPSLEEFLYLCKSIILHPYIELKYNGNYTETQIQQVIDMVSSYGLKGKVTYISFSTVYLQYVKNYDSKARIGVLGTLDGSSLGYCEALQTGENEVFFDSSYYDSAITSEYCDLFRSEGIHIEAWTVNSASDMLALNPYVSGITSDNLIAGKVLYDNAMSNA